MNLSGHKKGLLLFLFTLLSIAFMIFFNDVSTYVHIKELKILIQKNNTEETKGTRKAETESTIRVFLFFSSAISDVIQTMTDARTDEKNAHAKSALSVTGTNAYEKNTPAKAAENME